MIEKLVISKIRIKLLKLFLTNMNDRYYLRELERMLDESLSPLRRQLLRLEKVGILTSEEEANLKYYRLNKNFDGLEELRRLVLGEVEGGGRKVEHHVELPPEEVTPEAPRSVKSPAVSLRFMHRLDTLLLTGVSVILLLSAALVVYSSTINMRQIAKALSTKTTEVAEITTRKIAEPTRPDEMVSKRWKIIPGNIPVFSSGEMRGGKEL